VQGTLQPLRPLFLPLLLLELRGNCAPVTLPLLPSGTVLMSCPKVAAFNRTRSTTWHCSDGST